MKVWKLLKNITISTRQPIDRIFKTTLKDNGRYHDFSLYGLKGVNTKEILRAAQDAGINHKQLWYDALSPETAEILQKDIDFCHSKKVNATPSMVINDKLIVGLKNPENLREILEDTIDIDI